jgi:BlaI family transcriptional regulator, penicillinase repressor
VRITEAESHIMEALWREGPSTPDEIVLAVKNQGWAPGTVKTLINRLLKKGALQAGRSGERYEYRPAIERGDYALTESQHLIDRLFQGQIAPLVSHFAEHKKLSAQDIARLKELIERLEK